MDRARMIRRASHTLRRRQKQRDGVSVCADSQSVATVPAERASANGHANTTNIGQSESMSHSTSNSSRLKSRRALVLDISFKPVVRLTRCTAALISFAPLRLSGTQMHQHLILVCNDCDDAGCR